MAQEITVNVKVTGADKGTKEIDKLKKATEDADEKAQSLGESVEAAWGEVNILGTSLGSVKKAFGATLKSAKLMFTSIKVGLISTGIGAFVVAIGSLVTYFTSTQEGAEKLEIAMAKLGATFTVIKDRVSNFGEGLLKIFKKGGFKEGIDQMGDSFKGIGEEIKNDSELMGELTKRAIALREAEREINVETAQRRADIEQLKMISEDLTKTEDERLAAAQKAFEIENNLVAKRLANAEEAVRIQMETMETSENMEEDLEKLTQLEINLANVRQESTTKQIELNNKINSIIKEGEANRKAAKEKEDADKAKADKQREDDLEVLRVANQTAIDEELFQAEKKYQKLLELANKYGQDTTVITEQYGKQVDEINKKYSKEEEDREKAIQDSKVKMISDGLGALSGLMEENSTAAKGFAVAQALYNTYQGITNALASVPPPWNLVQAGITAATGFTAVRNILKTDPEEDSVDDSSGGVTPSPTGTGPMNVDNLIPNQLTENLTETTQQPVQAYVVETDISNSQALQEELDLQTTL